MIWRRFTGANQGILKDLRVRQGNGDGTTTEDLGKLSISTWPEEAAPAGRHLGSAESSELSHGAQLFANDDSAWPKGVAYGDLA